MKLRSFANHIKVLFVILVVMLPACVLSPYDGQKVVATTTDPVSFAGTHSSANGAVHLYFYNFSTSSFELFTTVYAATTPIWNTPDGDPLYAWSYRGVLPARFWQPGVVSGAKGKLLFRHDVSVFGGVLITFRRDWVRCWLANPVMHDFLLNCHSPNTPEATFYTYDFDDGLI